MTVDEAITLAEAFPEQMRGLACADLGSLDLADGFADALTPELLEYCFGTRDRDGLKASRRASDPAQLRNMDAAGGLALVGGPPCPINRKGSTAVMKKGERAPLPKVRAEPNTVQNYRALRKALAVDLTERMISANYEMFSLAVEQARDRLKANPGASQLSRQEIDAGKALLSMGGVEKLSSDEQQPDISRLSLAELEKLISDLKVVDAVATEDLDILK